MLDIFNKKNRIVIISLSSLALFSYVVQLVALMGNDEMNDMDFVHIVAIFLGLIGAILFLIKGIMQKLYFKEQTISVMLFLSSCFLTYCRNIFGNQNYENALFLCLIVAIIVLWATALKNEKLKVPVFVLLFVLETYYFINIFTNQNYISLFAMVLCSMLTLLVGGIENEN